MSATTKAWSNPAEAFKAIASGVITFVGAVVLSLSTNSGNSAPSLVQWLIAGIFGLGALVTTYWVPNANAKQKAAVQAVEKVAVDVVEHNPAAAISDATVAADQYWKQAFVTGNATPPTPVVASKEPLSTVASTGPVNVAPPKPAYTGPIPPVSEPVGATAVSATT